METGEGSSTPTIDENYTYVQPLYLNLAKAGRFIKLGKAAVALAQLIDHKETCGFTAGENGGFYVRVESELPDGMYLVAPDGAFNFEDLAGMTVATALEDMAAYSDSHAIAKWKELAEWIHSMFSVLSSAVSSATGGTVCGLPVTTSAPAFTDPGSRISVFFRWIKEVLISAGGEGVLMSEYRSAQNRYDIPLTISTNVNNEPITFSLSLHFLI